MGLQRAAESIVVYLWGIADAVKPVTTAMGQTLTKQVKDFQGDCFPLKTEFEKLNNKTAEQKPGTSEYRAAQRKAEAEGSKLRAAMVRSNKDFFPYMKEEMSNVVGAEKAEAIMWTPYLRQQDDAPEFPGQEPYSTGDVIDSDSSTSHYSYSSYGGFDSLNSNGSLDLTAEKPLKDVNHRTFGTVPLAHSQVEVTLPDQKPIKMSASHIQIKGVHKGIAMQAPRPEELDCVLQAIIENQTGIVVDLVSDTDRWKSQDDPILNWSDRYSVQNSKHFEVVPLTSEEKVINDGENEYPYTTRTFKIKSKSDGKEKTFSQISFTQWPDGQSVPHPVLKKFLTHVAHEQTKYPTDNDKGNLMINCRAGLGRTGVSFVGLHIMEQAKLQQPTAETLGQLTLEGMIHGRISRSGDFVQYIQQVSELIELEKSYI